MAIAASSQARTMSSLSRLITARSRLSALQDWAKTRFIDAQTFHAEFLTHKRPGVFRRLISDDHSPYRWSASSEWTKRAGHLDGLRSIVELQNAVVEVEVARVGRGYGEGVRTTAETDDVWTQIKMPFNLFQDAFIDGKIPWHASSDVERVGYVAQQDLFDVATTLQRQCPPLPHTSAGPRGATEQWRRNVWFGGAGTFTPVHCDPYENVFAQVVGSKRVHIFPPSVRDHLYLFDRSTTRQANTSSIPTEWPLLQDGQSYDSEYPLLAEAIEHPDACCVILDAGDVVYIPQGWYHCVASLSVSASVNAWFR